MKAFISGIITLSILIIAVIFNSAYIVGVTDEILIALYALPDSVDNADTEVLSYLWEKHSPIISLTVDRRTIDEIEDSISLMKAEVRGSNENEYLITLARLKSLFQRLKATEGFNVSRIF